MFYVPKKNRCNSSNCPDLFSNMFTCYATNSSIKTDIEGSKEVYTNYQSKSNEYKNNGNLNKLGSGGNSYHAYLLRKKGNIKCNCNTKCKNCKNC